MRTAFVTLSILVLAASGAVHAQVHSPGGVGVRTYDVAPFSSISDESMASVVVHVGGEARVQADGDLEPLGRLQVGVENGELQIRMAHAPEGAPARSSLTVHVTAPRLDSVAVTGSGDMRIDRLTGGAFAAAVTASGRLDIESMDLSMASFTLVGSGGLRGAGRVQNLTVTVAGSGDADLSAVESQSVRLTASASGSVSARASSFAEVTAIGSGSVTVTGGPRCTVQALGSGTVRCGD